jgi:biopolymer transport protein ExbD
MSDINTTPLVDVMLVMLIIFLITIPVIVPTVKVDLPDPRNIATQTKPEDIPVSIDRDGNVYWRGGRVEDRAKLLELMVEQARLDPQPELHLKADRNAAMKTWRACCSSSSSRACRRCPSLPSPRRDQLRSFERTNMSMNVSSGGSEEPMCDVNTTPLIDVMLVLLVMLIVTLPTQNHGVLLDMPRPTDAPPPRFRLKSSTSKSISTAPSSGIRSPR